MILKKEPIDFQWPMENPFIFCAHHQDVYPKGNAAQGPDVSLSGRYIGNDFVKKDGFRMYHGQRVAGFPVHPHRGFETVTIVLEGFVDHFDSKGAKGRYGEGDVQWLTTGSGCQHTEMFPATRQDDVNPLELFQVWLNLPSKDKFTEPDYKMLWSEDIPIIKEDASTVRLISGRWKDRMSLKPASASWAANPDNAVRIAIVTIEANQRFVLPKTEKDAVRNVYLYENQGVKVDGEWVEGKVRLKLESEQDVTLETQKATVKFLLLEGKPIQEPIMAYGPFVMTTENEIRQAFEDYEKTRFGGWPWESDEPVNEVDSGRFALHMDGRFEKKG